MPKKTVETIIGSGNHYVIGVKKNQPTLYRHMEAQAKERTIGWCIEMERNKGRFERREIRVYPLDGAIASLWKGAKQFVQIKRVVKKKGKQSRETAYFISSIDVSALSYNMGIRSHWSIENCLHWVKDVTLKEDASKIMSGSAPSILSTLRNGILNIFRKHGMNEIAKAIRLVSNDIKTINQLIA
ncbi:MAG: ISAs1 family transposase [Bacteroidota bacterium]